MGSRRTGRGDLNKFSGLVGDERSTKIRLVSADGVSWIGDVVAERCAIATLCIDRFHVCPWTSKVLEGVHPDVWNRARKVGMSQHTREPKAGRWALWRNPEEPTPRRGASRPGSPRRTRPGIGPN